MTRDASFHKFFRLCIVITTFVQVLQCLPTHGDWCVCSNVENVKFYEKPSLNSDVVCYFHKGVCLNCTNCTSSGSGFYKIGPQQLTTKNIPDTYFVYDGSVTLTHAACPRNESHQTCKLQKELYHITTVTNTLTTIKCPEQGNYTLPSWTGPPYRMSPAGTRYTSERFAPFNQGLPTDTLARLSYADNQRDLLLNNTRMADGGKYTCSVAGQFMDDIILHVKATPPSVTYTISSRGYSSWVDDHSYLSLQSKHTTRVIFIAHRPVFCQGNWDYRGAFWQGGLSWPGSASWPCKGPPFGIDSNETITVHCNIEGVYIPFFDCFSSTLKDIQDEINKQIEHPDEETLFDALEALHNFTTVRINDISSFYEGELTRITVMLETVAGISSNSTVSIEQAQTFIEISGDLLDQRNKRQWQTIAEYGTPYKNDTFKGQGAARVLRAIEIYATSIVNSFGTNETSRTFIQRNMVLHVARHNETDRRGIRFPDNTFADINTSSVMYIDHPTILEKGIQGYAGVLYKNLTGIMPTTTTLDGDTSTKPQTNSFVLALTTYGQDSLNDIPVTITFQHFQTTFKNPQCTFWNYTVNAWDTTGCSLNETNESTSVCICSHLTNFAILMNPWEVENTVAKTIDIVSTVGCSISMAGLVVTVIVHLVLWKFMKSNKAVILLNLSVALVISYFIFLFGVDQTENKLACKVIAVALQYIYLTVFFLMLVEGIEIAVAVLYVFKRRSYLMLKLLAAWGVPAVIVGISAGVTRLQGYGTDTFCWLSIHNGLIWTFVGPAACIVVVNSVLLVIILKVMLGTKTMTQKGHFHRMKASIRGLCVLLPLIGCTWIIGMLYVNNNFTWVQYAFAVCNSLQGLVIFIFQVLVNDQVRIAMQKRRRMYALSEPTISSQPMAGSAL